MGSVISFLEALRERIGYESLVFISFSFITLIFLEQLRGNVSEQIEVILQGTAGILFSVGLLIAFLRSFHSLFTLRPAKGMIDGLASGFMAGLFGGYFGYGLHHGSQYTTHPFIRAILCVPFAIAIGGVLGLCIDLYHPDRSISWRKYASALVAAFAILFSLVGVSIFMLVPKTKDAG